MNVSYVSLVDGLRRAPTSFAELTYYSQFAYQLTTTDGIHLAARFRLIPTQHAQETGMLQTREQEEPWNTTRTNDEERRKDYLRTEFIDRLRQDEPVSYQLQIQTRNDIHNPITWHPQQVSLVSHVNLEYYNDPHTCVYIYIYII